MLVLIQSSNCLSNADYIRIATEDVGIKRRLSAFRFEETQRWRAYKELTEQVAEHIVVPSGSWQAKIAHHLHVPSFTSLKIANGEVGDITSPCTAIVLENKFDPRTHFIFDHFHRRTPLPFKPFSLYPDDIRRLHQDLTDWIRETIHAKVEILYGADVRRWALKTLNLSNIRLWGDYENVWLFFEWGNSNRKELSKILLFALHPQRFLSLNMKSNPEAVRQDQVISCAYKLAGLPFNDKYYSLMPWISKADFLSKASISRLGESERHQSNQLFSLLKTSKAQTPATSNIGETTASSSEEQERLSGTETTGDSPTSSAMSVKRLYEILMEVLSSQKGTQKGKRNFQQKYRQIIIDESQFLPSLPPLIREWIEKQQKHFFGCTIQKPADLIPAYARHCTNGTSNDLVVIETVEIIRALMNFQQRLLNSGVKKFHSNPQLSQQFPTFEMIPRACDTCQTPMDPDPLPLFSLTHDGKYLARALRCSSEICQGLMRHGLPLNGLPYLLAGCAPESSKDWQKGLREAGDCGHLASSVELWCGFCQGKTVVGAPGIESGQNTAIDANPRWTLGFRAKYVPRGFPCATCGVSSQKFVPVDHQIPFINKQTLDRLVKRFSYMDTEALTEILDAQNSASHFPRKPKRSREEGTYDKEDGRCSAKSKFSRQLKVGDLKVEDYTKPQVVDLKCEKCAHPCGQNVNPKWHAKTGEYIALRRINCPEWCTVGRVWLIPQDENIPWMRATKLEAQLRREAKQMAESAESVPELEILED
ncbi:hypothetical protein N7474_009826 [Penicillium riverlandense]|uniref:uncharacterized protein n=1 Tax=Penicillium riverlandense TaxID=1903569 RepID=UPI002547BFCD|nr:uncharacterized protein N7474_009826 [Penicillium riverlandense]KAJ5808557.1 hypothetical protein N7474_009826 [Penicillium riverlandense]